MNGRHLFRSRGDVIMATILVAVVVIFTVLGLSRSHKTIMTGSYDLSAKEKSSLESTIRKFIVTDGTFGVDWGSDTASAENFDIQGLHDQWISTLYSGEDLPDPYKSVVTSRSMVVASLLQTRADATPALMLSDSDLADLGPNDLNVLSDGMWMSGFTVDSNDVAVNWKTMNSTMGGSNDDTLTTTVDISWTSRWTRATVIPDAYKNIDRSDWKIQEKDLDFNDVKVTAVRTDDGRSWQISGLSDDGRSNSLSTYGGALATAGDISYDVNGVITGRDVNKNLQDNDESGD